MGALEGFRQVIVGIYEMMQACEVPIFGHMFSLWDIYLYGFVCGVGVFIFFKFIKS